MNRLVRALAPLALVAALPLTVAAAPVRHAAAARPVAARVSNDIIPLPLNPVLPAGQRLCTQKTASGLGYTILRPATGAKPAAEDYALVNYIGYLAATGAVFDQGMGAAFPVNGVVPGFSEGLQLLGKGGIARFCVPAALGYGAQGTGPIPANADLVFQVELVDFKTAAEVDALRKADGGSAQPAPDASAPQQH